MAGQRAGWILGVALGAWAWGAGPLLAAMPDPPAGLVGSPAPDFLFRPVQGAPFRLSTLKGRVVVLRFWATWCSDSIGEMARTRKLYQTLGPKGVVFLGACRDTLVGPDEVVAVAREHGHTFPQMMCAGADPNPWELYRMNWLPTLVIIDAEGVIRGLDLGDEGSRLAGAWASITRVLPGASPPPAPARPRPR